MKHDTPFNTFPLQVHKRDKAREDEADYRALRDRKAYLQGQKDYPNEVDHGYSKEQQVCYNMGFAYASHYSL